MPETLASILDPLTPSDFRSNYYEKKALYISSRPDKFKHLFDWESINGVLNSSPIPHPTMKMVLEGKPVIIEDTNAVGIIQRCREGATLIIDHIDKYNNNVGELATALSDEIGEITQVNLYLSQPSRQGFTRHYDTHDVFILQISGFKGWRVFDSTVKFPLYVQKFHGLTPPETPYLECTLEPGDVLYIPRGHWHEATAQLEQSVHLTVGIYARTGINFLSWLVDELRDDVRWRETFPLVFKEEFSTVDELSPATIGQFEKLRSFLIDKINETSLPYDYRRFCVAQERKRSPFNFPAQILKASVKTQQYKKFSRSRHQRVVLESKPEDEIVEVTIQGKVLKFSVPAEQLLKFIFTVTTFTDKDLLHSAPELSWNDIVFVLDCLVKEEIIEILE